MLRSILNEVSWFRVLPQWYQEANIRAVYTLASSSSSDRIKICIDFLSPEHLCTMLAVRCHRGADQGRLQTSRQMLTYVYC